MGEHQGRVALITGGSQGIGKGIAVELSLQGSAVVVHGQTRDFAEECAAQLTAEGGRAVAVWGSIDDPETSRAAVALALDAFGRLDTLITSAGIQRYGDVVSTSEETWDEVFNVNVKGVYLAAREALPHIRRSLSGAVAVISSVQALATQAQVAAYTASKGALNALVRAMAVDEGKYGVRVNAVLPGSVDTPMLRASAALFSDGTNAGLERTLSEWGRSHVLGRIGQPSEVGTVVSFLTSPRASFVTGAEICVDGGLLAQIAAALPEKH